MQSPHVKRNLTAPAVRLLDPSGHPGDPHCLIPEQRVALADLIVRAREAEEA